MKQPQLAKIERLDSMSSLTTLNRYVHGLGLKSIFETDFKRHSEPRLPATAQINH